MDQTEFQREIKQIQETLQKLRTRLSRVFDSEDRNRKIKAELEEKQSAKTAYCKKSEICRCPPFHPLWF